MQYLKGIYRTFLISIVFIMFTMLAGCGGDSNKIDIELELDTTLLKQAHLNQYQIILELELKNNQIFVIEHGFELSNDGSNVKNIHDLPLYSYIANIEVVEEVIFLDSDLSILYPSYDDVQESITRPIQIFVNRISANSTVNVKANDTSKIQYTIVISDVALNEFEEITQLGVKMVTAGGIEYHRSSLIRQSELDLIDRSGAFGIGTVPGQTIEYSEQDGYQIRTDLANNTLYLQSDSGLYNSQTMQHTNKITSIRLDVR